ncbi:MAG: gliding motility protein GldN, partial [Prevotella sp.]|nr:gliding motility protein GldN [Prevotella sp.]
MKRLLLILSIACVTVGLSAQPAARRQQQQRQSNAENITTRARVTFPTAAPMSEDVVWRRDIYRELDLNTEANSGLYYPVEPIGTQMNLFTYIFKLMMT